MFFIPKNELFVQIKFKALNRKFLFQSIYIFSFFLGIFKNPYQIFFLPLKKNTITILNSPHVNRRSQKQFYAPLYKAIIIFSIKKKSTLHYLLLYFLTNSGIFFSIKLSG